jgi:hypothetical protein
MCEFCQTGTFGKSLKVERANRDQSSLWVKNRIHHYLQQNLFQFFRQLLYIERFLYKIIMAVI